MSRHRLSRTRPKAGNPRHASAHAWSCRNNSFKAATPTDSLTPCGTLCKVCRMIKRVLPRIQSPNPLSPTLWRTCRALANRRRLEMIRYIITCQQAVGVTDVASKMGLSVPATSQYLRALNARGLLEARRRGRHVFYQAKSDPALPAAGVLLRSLKHTLVNRRNATESVFQHVTAFTHVRRIAVVQAVARGALRIEDICQKTASSRRATVRHVRKLVRRGFLARGKDGYHIAKPNSMFARALIQLALASS